MPVAYVLALELLVRLIADSGFNNRHQGALLRLSCSLDKDQNTLPSQNPRVGHRRDPQAVRQQSNRPRIPRIPHKPVLRPNHRNARNPQIWFGYIHCRDQMIADDKSQPLSSRHCILGKDHNLGGATSSSTSPVPLQTSQLIIS